MVTALPWDVCFVFPNKSVLSLFVSCWAGLSGLGLRWKVVLECFLWASCFVVMVKSQCLIFLSSPEDISSLLLETEGGSEEGRERNTDVREKHLLVASHMCPGQELYVSGLGIKPATQECAQSGIEPITFQLRDNAPTN